MGVLKVGKGCGAGETHRAHGEVEQSSDLSVSWLYSDTLRYECEFPGLYGSSLGSFMGATESQG